MRYFLENLELILSAVGLLVIVVATQLLSPIFADPWQVAAVTATTIGLVHGTLFFLIRRRQRQARRAALAEVQEMLQDIINNQLAVIQGVHEFFPAHPVGQAVRMVNQSVETISSSLRSLSEESLATWKARYPHRARRAGEK